MGDYEPEKYEREMREASSEAYEKKQREKFLRNARWVLIAVALVAAAYAAVRYLYLSIG